MKQTRLLTILWAMTLMLAIVTQSAWAQSTSDIGKVLGADGKMYKTDCMNVASYVLSDL